MKRKQFSKMNKVEISLNGINATYFCFSPRTQELRKEMRPVFREYKFRYRWTPENIRSMSPAVKEALEAEVCIDEYELIYECHNG